MFFYSHRDINIKESEVDTLEKVVDVIHKLKENLTTDNDLWALQMAYETEDLAEIKALGEELRNSFSKIVVLGIGGSSLGAKTFLALKDESPVIVLESIDSDTVKNVFSSLDLKTTAFLTVSKSGKTIECISQTLLALKMVEDELGRGEISKRFFFLTEDKDSPLTRLAKEFDIRVIAHHKKIGGRFSYLSNVCLIPAQIAGLNIEDIRGGAADVLDYVFRNEDNFIADICAKQAYLYNHNVKINVVMPYIDKLVYMNEWYRQIWAESLGKNGFGTTPVNAIGTSDQHSQLQLYVDGPRDKFFTFIYRKNKKRSSPIIEKEYEEGFSYLKGRSLDDIMQIQYESTIKVLQEKDLPIRMIELEELNERCLSQLLMQFMLETIIIGKIHNINPFGQPGVEGRKQLEKEMFAFL